MLFGVSFFFENDWANKKLDLVFILKSNIGILFGCSLVLSLYF